MKDTLSAGLGEDKSSEIIIDSDFGALVDIIIVGRLGELVPVQER